VISLIWRFIPLSAVISLIWRKKAPHPVRTIVSSSFWLLAPQQQQQQQQKGAKTTKGREQRPADAVCDGAESACRFHRSMGGSVLAAAHCRLAVVVGVSGRGRLINNSRADGVEASE
jgi:hypothetical protein